MGYYGDWPQANQIFRSVNCFEQVAHNEKNWDLVYCADIVILLTLSLVNFCLLDYLLYIQFKKFGCTCKAFTKISTSIIFLGILLNLIIFIR